MTLIASHGGPALAMRQLRAVMPPCTRSRRDTLCAGGVRPGVAPCEPAEPAACVAVLWEAGLLPAAAEV
jgi:hypothetical protein